MTTPKLYLPRHTRLEGVDGFSVHQTRRIGNRIIQVIDFDEGGDAKTNAAHQHLVEDTVGEITGDNDIAVKEGQRARDKREAGWSTFKSWAREVALNERAAKHPVCQVYEDEAGNPYIVSAEFNFETERHEVVGGKVGEDGTLSETWAMEVTRKV